MPQYMAQVRYSESAIRGMVENPSDRAAAVKANVEGFGGKLLSFHFCFGEFDAVMIVESPDNISVAAGIMAAAATGSMAHCQTTVLMTTEEAQKAMQKAHTTRTEYKAPHALT